jgi:hypothetical protein
MSESVDREISLRGLIGFVAGLVALLVATGVLMWLLSAGLREARVAADPPPPRLPEARQLWEPPGPRLQADPPADMAALRADEERILSTWGWTDQGAGLAQVPIERAMELLVEERVAEENGS